MYLSTEIIFSILLAKHELEDKDIEELGRRYRLLEGRDDHTLDSRTPTQVGDTRGAKHPLWQLAGTAVAAPQQMHCDLPQIASIEGLKGFNQAVCALILRF
jgi:hypothetical protein